MRFRNTILLDVFLLLLVIVFGTVGFMAVEHWHFLDALYMTITTLSTIGFGEVHPLSTAGRVFTIILILVGIGTITYTLTSISSFIFRGTLYTLLHTQAMEQKVKALRGHYIICGASDTNQVVMKELALSKTPFVLIEQNEDKIKKLLHHLEFLYVHGDATDEHILRKAGAEQAVGLIAALGDDHDEVYLIMTAREISKTLKIYARINEEKSRKKFLLAGADVIINPNEIGGMRIASTILRPQVVQFIENLVSDPKQLRIEEMPIDASSPFANQTLDIDEVQRTLQARIIALRKASDKSYQYYFPKKKIAFEVGDSLIILQSRES